MDLETLSLTEIVRLQSQLAEVLRRRFERTVALCFTDVVGSTTYFARHGDAAGKALQQRHFDLLQKGLTQFGGKLIDTAGDGAFACFPSLKDAANAMVQLQNAIAMESQGFAEEHRLSVRSGLHWGRALTDGVLVSGDAVNVCARVAATGSPGEIVLTRDAFLQLPPDLRLRCVARSSAQLKGISEAVELWGLRWRASARPTSVLVNETGLRFALPAKPVISLGRLRSHNGGAANDLVLECQDPEQTRLISRWHLELHADGDALFVRALADDSTTLDGILLARDRNVALRSGSVVRVADVLTLVFANDDDPAGFSQSTLAAPTRR